MQSFAVLPSGVRLHYLEQGPADGTALIFLHGVTDSCHSFDGVLPLLPRHIRAFAVSQRGHGESSRPPSGYGVPEMAGDLRAFMDVVGVRTAVIIGHSMGASVAQRFLIDYPERTSAAVLVGAFASFHEDAGFREFVEGSILPLVDPIPAAFVREWQLSTLANPMDLGHFETIVAEALKVPAFVWHATFRGFLASADLTSQLANVAVPVLLVWGERDTYTSRAAQDRLLRVIPDARFATYQGAGHALHWEEPARFTRDLLMFVAQRASALV